MEYTAMAGFGPQTSVAGKCKLSVFLNRVAFVEAVRSHEMALGPNNLWASPSFSLTEVC